LEFNVPFQHKYGYIRDELTSPIHVLSTAMFLWYCLGGRWGPQ